MNYRQESLKKHAEWRGKIETAVRVPTDSREALSLAYTPGVAEPCLAIAKDPEKSFELTRRWNTVPVITDGTAVLGLGDIGPEAGMPVMEGKCALFKAYGGVDAFPICIKSKDVDEIVNTIKLISGSFGGINLEDISAPRCFEIETRLKNELDIPVFHDDQHGTAIVMAAALINAAKVVGKSVDALRVVINGAGAAGIAIAKYLLNLGVADIVLCDKFGVIVKGQSGMNAAQAQMAEITNKSGICGTLSDAMKGADVFIGVSAPNVVSKDMVRSMAKGAIVFSCANPVPEISREDALEAGAAVVGTGSSEKPNQINNVLIFPGLFKGALAARAKRITEEMKTAAAYALAGIIGEDELSADYIIPSAFHPGAADTVAAAVEKAWKDNN